MVQGLCASSRTQRVQGAYSSFLRYDFKHHLKELPCDEANGSPTTECHCNGTLIRHQWGEKRAVKQKVAEQIAQAVIERVHAHFIEDEDQVMVPRPLGPGEWDLEDVTAEYKTS